MIDHSFLFAESGLDFKLFTDSLVSQDDGENFVTEIMGWEQRIWTENVLFGPWGPLS